MDDDNNNNNSNNQDWSPSNQYPIVLVHGAAGWGRDELFGVKYWGGWHGDLQADLVRQGYQVFTVAIGPISSTWDRACELFAQIKGGQVDYGATHAKTHGHHQHGRTYPGLYPQWGTKDEHGKIRKVHLIGHSMGGQTSRMLAQLLAHGTKGAPIHEDPTTSSELFQGGHHDWVHSVTTLSTPIQGDTLADALIQLGSLFIVVAMAFVKFLNGFGVDVLFDVKLDQWGLAPRKPSEPWTSYMTRAFKSPAFRAGSKDYCLWSISMDGTLEENTWVKTLPGVYYFSFATQDTHHRVNVLGEPVQVPNWKTMPTAMYVASIVGGRFAIKKQLPVSWQANDGLVNTESMLGDGVAPHVAFQGSVHRGKWNHMATLAPMHHLAVIGFSKRKNILPLYYTHVELLMSLPVHQDDDDQDVDAQDDMSQASKQVVVVLPVAITRRFQQVVASFESNHKHAAILDYYLQVVGGSLLTPSTTASGMDPKPAPAVTMIPCAA